MKAVLFIDNDTVSVVLGKLLKQVKIQELSATHNAEFFNTLFSEHMVVIVDAVRPISRDEFYMSFDGVEPTETEKTVASEPVAAEPEPKIKMRLQVPQAAPQEETRDGSIWIRHTQPAIIIVDDLFTSAEIRGAPGSRMSLAIPPNRAVDLSALDKDDVKKSVFLRKLLANGTLFQITPSEARKLEGRFWAAENKKKELDDKHLEKLLIPAGRSAADYAENPDADGTEIDLTNEVETDNPETEFDDLLKTMKKARVAPVQEEEVEVRETARGATLAEQVRMAESMPEAPKRKLAERQREVDPDAIAPKGFAKRHR